MFILHANLMDIIGLSALLVAGIGYFLMWIIDRFSKK